MQKGRELISGYGRRYYNKVVSEVTLIIVAYLASVIFFAQVNGLSVPEFVLGDEGAIMWFVGMGVMAYCAYAIIRYTRWARTRVLVFEHAVEGRGIGLRFVVEPFSFTYDKITEVELIPKRAIIVHTEEDQRICFCELPAEVRIAINTRIEIFKEEQQKFAEKAEKNE